jgi:hypothetical protein
MISESTIWPLSHAPTLIVTSRLSRADLQAPLARELNERRVHPLALDVDR